MVTSLSLEKKRFDVHLAIFTPIKFYWQVISTSHNELLCRWWWRFSFIDVNYFPWQQSAKPHRVKQTTINRMGNLTFPLLIANPSRLISKIFFKPISFFSSTEQKQRQQNRVSKKFIMLVERVTTWARRERERENYAENNGNLTWISLPLLLDICPISKPILHD